MPLMIACLLWSAVVAASFDCEIKCTAFSTSTDVDSTSAGCEPVRPTSEARKVFALPVVERVGIACDRHRELRHAHLQLALLFDPAIKLAVRQPGPPSSDIAADFDQKPEPVLSHPGGGLAQLASDIEHSRVIETRLRVECCCGRTLRRDFVVVGNRDRWD